MCGRVCAHRARALENKYRMPENADKTATLSQYNKVFAACQPHLWILRKIQEKSGRKSRIARAYGIFQKSDRSRSTFRLLAYNKSAQTRRGWRPRQPAWHNAVCANNAATCKPVGAIHEWPASAMHNKSSCKPVGEGLAPPAICDFIPSVRDPRPHLDNHRAFCYTYRKSPRKEKKGWTDGTGSS